MVPVEVAIVAAEAPAVQIPDQPLLGQELQVPIDGSQADPGKTAPHLPVHPLGGGVRVGPPNRLQDEAALVLQTGDDVALELIDRESLRHRARYGSAWENPCRFFEP